MPYHPSLNEVLEKNIFLGEEWAEFVVKGFSWSVWVSATRVIGEQPTPEYGFYGGPLRSEHRTFVLDKVIVDFELTSDESIKLLIGDPMPLGSFSYYFDNEAIVTLCVTPEVHKEIVTLVRGSLGQLTIRIAIPKWGDTECKCLPITQYQLIYNSSEDAST